MSTQLHLTYNIVIAIKANKSIIKFVVSTETQFQSVMWFETK